MTTEALLVSQEDMTSAFYLFRLPREWCRFFDVGLRVKLTDLKGNSKAKKASRRMAEDCNCDGWGYLVLQVLPMGWKPAVGIMQAIHRRLLGSYLAGSSRLPSNAEIRKIMPMPTSASQRTEKAWQVHPDNYASLIVAKLQKKPVP